MSRDTVLSIFKDYKAGTLSLAEAASKAKPFLESVSKHVENDEVWWDGDSGNSTAALYAYASEHDDLESVVEFLEAVLRVKPRIDCE